MYVRVGVCIQYCVCMKKIEDKAANNRSLPPSPTTHIAHATLSTIIMEKQRSMWIIVLVVRLCN